MRLSGATRVAGVTGAPVTHSLSPLIHNAWLAAAGSDGVYVPFAATEEGFEALVEAFRGGVIAGLNVTAPFKQRALAAADLADPAAESAGAANLLLFREDGVTVARNTDGTGLLAALASQAPGLELPGAVVVLIGAGGAGRSAATVLVEAGAKELRIVNRTFQRARILAKGFGETACPCAWETLAEAFEGADLIVNATSPAREEADTLKAPWEAARPDAVAMDMVYRPLRTPFLKGAAERGLTTVDGLEMLIGQARPSFEAFYGAPPPDTDVRALALRALGESK